MKYRHTKIHFMINQTTFSPSYTRIQVARSHKSRIYFFTFFNLFYCFVNMRVCKIFIYNVNFSSIFYAHAGCLLRAFCLKKKTLLFAFFRSLFSMGPLNFCFWALFVSVLFKWSGTFNWIFLDGHNFSVALESCINWRASIKKIGLK